MVRHFPVAARVVGVGHGVGNVIDVARVGLNHAAADIVATLGCAAVVLIIPDAGGVGVVDRAVALAGASLDTDPYCAPPALT